MVQRMVLRSSAAHQPSSSRRITWPPQSSSSMNRSGTPVSVSSNTSSRQQQAAHELQLTLGSLNCRWGMKESGMPPVYASAQLIAVSDSYQLVEILPTSTVLF